MRRSRPHGLPIADTVNETKPAPATGVAAHEDGFARDPRN